MPAVCSGAHTPPRAAGAGRVDDSVEAVTPDGRLPNADTGHGQAANAHHLRYDVSYQLLTLTLTLARALTLTLTLT